MTYIFFKKKVQSIKAKTIFYHLSSHIAEIQKPAAIAKCIAIILRIVFASGVDLHQGFSLAGTASAFPSFNVHIPIFFHYYNGKIRLNFWEILLQ